MIYMGHYLLGNEHFASTKHLRIQICPCETRRREEKVHKRFLFFHEAEIEKHINSRIGMLELLVLGVL